jgi:dTDP-4-amino-4,6-dideoxygalactose transaminase
MLTQYKKMLDVIFNSGDYILGKSVSKFEQNFASYIGVRCCVGVASGTDAMLLSVKALGLQKGDEVIVPAFTFSATVSPLLLLGLKPILVDIYKNKPLIDVSQIEKVVTKKTKVIIPVHMYGMMCNMKEIKKIAKKHKVFIIEDACQAHGCEIDGKNAGSMGDIGIFSFYPSKNLGAFGDAGAIVTDKKALAEKLYLLRNHGQSEKYLHDIVGFNSRLDSIHAAILSEKLRYLDSNNSKRRKIARLYVKLLSGLPLTVVTNDFSTASNLHLFVVKTKKRDSLLKFLKKRGITCGIHYPIPIHLLPAFKSLGYKKGAFPNSESLANECLSLPMFPEITREEIIYIVNSIKLFYGF